MRKLFFSGALLWGLMPVAWAQTEAWQPSLWIEAVRVIGGLLLIIPLIYLAVRFWGKQNSGGGGKIVVLERTPLAQGKTLYLVKVGEEVFLLGGAERSLNLLRAYRGQEAQDLAQKPVDQELPQFDEILGGQIQRLKKIRTVFQKREKGQRD